MLTVGSLHPSLCCIFMPLFLWRLYSCKNSWHCCTWVHVHIQYILLRIWSWKQNLPVSLSAYSKHSAGGSPNQADIHLPAKAVFSKVIKCRRIKPESKQNFYLFINFYRINASVLASFQSPMMCGSNSRLATNFPHRSANVNLTRLLMQVAEENERGLTQKAFAALRILCLLLFTTIVFVLFICSWLF